MNILHSIQYPKSQYGFNRDKIENKLKIPTLLMPYDDYAYCTERLAITDFRGLRHEYQLRRIII